MKNILKTAVLASVLAPVAGALGAADAIPARPEQIAFKPLAWAPPAAKDRRVVLEEVGRRRYLAGEPRPPARERPDPPQGRHVPEPARQGRASPRPTGWLLARGGTKKRKAEELEERLAFLAAQLNPERAGRAPDGRAGASATWTTAGIVSLNLLAKDLDEGLAILREVLTEPAFQEDRLKLRKEQLLAEMKQRNDSSAAIESPRAFRPPDRPRLLRRTAGRRRPPSSPSRRPTSPRSTRAGWPPAT